jgi:hypothetical protein
LISEKRAWCCGLSSNDARELRNSPLLLFRRRCDSNGFMRKLTWSLLALFTIGAVGAAAQATVQTIPTPPTDAGVTLRVSGLVVLGYTVTRTGNSFSLQPIACPITCNSSFDVVLGPLPPGTYTFNIPDSSIGLGGSGSFVVVPSVPAISRTALIALCAALLGAGVILSGRQT